MEDDDDGATGPHLAAALKSQNTFYYTLGAVRDEPLFPQIHGNLTNLYQLRPRNPLIMSNGCSSRRLHRAAIASVHYHPLSSASLALNNGWTASSQRMLHVDCIPCSGSMNSIIGSDHMVNEIRR